jgi:serine/threonine protein kinase
MKFYPMGDLSKAIENNRLTRCDFHSDVLRFLTGQRQRFSTAEVLHVCLDITHALIDCHSRGILHRDIKPENSMLSFVRLLANEYSPSSTPACEAWETGTNWCCSRRLWSGQAGIGKFHIQKHTCNQCHWHSCIFSAGKHSRFGSILLTNWQKEVLQGIINAKCDIFSLGCVAFEMCELQSAYRDLNKQHQPNMTGRYALEVESLIISAIQLDHNQRPDLNTFLARTLQFLPAAESALLVPAVLRARPSHGMPRRIQSHGQSQRVAGRGTGRVKYFAARPHQRRSSCTLM